MPTFFGVVAAASENPDTEKPIEAMVSKIAEVLSMNPDYMQGLFVALELWRTQNIDVCTWVIAHLEALRDEAMNDYIKSKLKVLDKYKDHKLEVKSKVDESIIGGFIVQVGDLFYDASIRHDLQVIKKQFIENMYVQKLR